MVPPKTWKRTVVVPFIQNWVNDVNTPGPNGEKSASYGGIGDITAVAKYNLMPEGDYRPAISAVAAGFSHGPRLQPQPGAHGRDPSAPGSFNFITGVNLFKYLKPVLVHSQIWMNTPINLYKIPVIHPIMSVPGNT